MATKARFLAGGQSLVPAHELPPGAAGGADRHQSDRRACRHRTRTAIALRIGALTRYRTLDRDPMTSRATCRSSPKRCRRSRIRRSAIAARIGGNLAHADPASEMPAIVLALGGRLHAHSATGERWIEAARFLRRRAHHRAQPDEMLTEVELPVAAAAQSALLPGDVAPARRFRHRRRCRTVTLDARGRLRRRAALAIAAPATGRSFGDAGAVARWPANRSARRHRRGRRARAERRSIRAAASMPARSISGISPAC